MSTTGDQAMLAGGINMGANAGASYAKASSIQMQAKYEADKLKYAAQLQHAQAQDAYKRGDKSAGKLGEAAKQFQGEQKVAVSPGVKSTKGSAARMISQTDKAAVEDQLTIRTNAIREAWGHRIQAAEYKGAARMTKLAAKNEIYQTAISGGAQFAKDAMKSYQLREKYGKPPADAEDPERQ